MQDAMLAAVIRFAPIWVRYVLTMSEIGRLGEGWVLADGDNIAIMDAGGTTAMPLWPYRSLAEGASGAEDEMAATTPAPVPTSISALELAENILPALVDHLVSVAVFPGPGENRVIGPEGVIRDLQAFTDEPRDVGAELELEPHAVEPEGWASLSVPDLGAAEAEADARFWLLEGRDGASVIGVVADGRPALAIFASKATAEDFAREVEVPAAPRAASANSLIGHWLLMAFTAQWDIAMLTDGGGSGTVKPVRLALDLAREARPAEAD